MPNVEQFRTDRLFGRRIRADDLAELVCMYQDEKVMATLGGVRTQEETRQRHEALLEHWARHGYGMWMMYHLEDGAFVGRGGLRSLEVDGVPEVEVGYAVRAEYRGKGYATEMARAYVRIAFYSLNLDNVVCFTLPTNLASRRVMEKVGFRYERDFIHAGEPHVFYRLWR